MGPREALFVKLLGPLVIIYYYHRHQERCVWTVRNIVEDNDITW